MNSLQRAEPSIRTLGRRRSPPGFAKSLIGLLPMLCLGIFIGKPYQHHPAEIVIFEETASTNAKPANGVEVGSISSSSTTTKTITWPDWPSVAHEELGHPLVFKGDSFVQKARDILLGSGDGGAGTSKTLLDDFIKVYKDRPDKVNLCGIRINHALALFMTVRQLQPTLVVESGVNAGVSTYFIRAAMPDAKIYALDPETEAICDQGKRWIDPSGKTTYFTGDKFIDLAEHQWRDMIEKGEMDPSKTLIFLDDHLHAIRRIPALIKAGIRHVIIEDNYKIGEGGTQEDKKGTPKQAFNANVRDVDRKADAIWLFNNLVAYAEFPPLVPPIMAKENTSPRKRAGGFMVAADDNKDIVAPILRPDLDPNDAKIYEKLAASLDLDHKMLDSNSYMQFMNYNQICYLELLPMPSHLAETL